MLPEAFAPANVLRPHSCRRTATGDLRVDESAADNLGAVEWPHAPGGESGVVPATFVQSDALSEPLAQTTLLPATFV